MVGSERPSGCASNYRDLQFHEVVSLFDPFDDDQMDAMEKSIKAEGIHTRIVLWNGFIIDGRNRFIAACNVGHGFTDADFRVWGGSDDDLLDYVWELNGDKCRRHMTKSQLACVGVKIKRAKESQIAAEKSRKCSAARRGARGDKEGLLQMNQTSTEPPARDASREAAEMVGVGKSIINDAENILELSPEVFAEISSGKKTIGEAARELGVAPGRYKVPNTDRKGRKSGGDKDVYIPANETKLKDTQDDHEERAAIRDQDSDEAWVEGLEPYRILSGRLRDEFARDAKLARQFWREGREQLKGNISRLLPGNKAKPYSFMAYVRALKQWPPDQWYVCPPPDQGGCGGAGKMPAIPECQLCKGRGYFVSS